MINSTIKLPIQITPCPVKDALVELRFESSLPSEIIYGLLYNKFRDDIQGNPSTFPVINIPRNIREVDPNLKYSPHYQFIFQEFAVKLAPKAIVVGCKDDYKGWKKYSLFTKKIFESLYELKLISHPVRLGVRYVSFFKDTDIFEKIVGTFEINNSLLTGKKNFVRTEFNIDQFLCVLQISNHSLTFENKAPIQGSSIDIDISKELSTSNDQDINTILKIAHETEKKLFFSLLKPEFLSSFNPEYENVNK